MERLHAEKEFMYKFNGIEVRKLQKSKVKTNLPISKDILFSRHILNSQIQTTASIGFVANCEWAMGIFHLYIM